MSPHRVNTPVHLTLGRQHGEIGALKCEYLTARASSHVNSLYRPGCRTWFYRISMRLPGCWLGHRWYGRHKIPDRCWCILCFGKISSCQSWGILSGLFPNECHEYISYGATAVSQQLLYFNDIKGATSHRMWDFESVCEKSAQFADPVLIQFRNRVSFRDDKYEVCLH